MSETPTLNGTPTSWTDIKITAQVNGGVELPSLDWKSFDWSSEIKRGDQKKGGRVVRRSSGEKTDTASGSLYRSGLDEFVDALVLVAPKDSLGRAQISKVKVDFIIEHSFEDDPDDIHIVKFLGCHLDKIAGKHAEGPEVDTVDVDLNPMEIVMVRKGVDVVLL
jgi:hypothetical protein